MKRYGILVLCPYEGMAEITENIKSDYPMFDVKVVVTDTLHEDYLDEVLAKKDFDLIMSRGNLSKYAKEHSSKPCIEIRIGMLDILTTIKMVDNFANINPIILGNIGIKEYVEYINELFNYSVATKLWKNKDEVGILVRQSVDEGYNFIIGDAIVQRATRQEGIPSMMILSSEKTIRNSFDRAVEFCRCVENITEKEAIWNYIAEGSGTYWNVRTEDGDVLFDNFKEADREIMLAAQEKAHTMHGKVRNGGFWKRGLYWEFQYSVETIGNHGPFCLLKVSENPELNENLNAAFSVDKDTYVAEAVSVILSMGDNKLKLREQIRDCADLDLSVLIIGEDGTGRNSYAKEIHKISRWKDSIFIQINCHELTPSSVQKLFAPEIGVFSKLQKATLYFAEIQTLDAEAQKVIIKFLSSRRNSEKFRLMSSSTMRKEELLTRRIVNRRLVALLSEVVLEVPSLVDAKENIMAITGLKLQEFNAKYGWRLTGVGEEGKRIMMNYSWPGNLNQLKDVLKLAVSNIEDRSGVSVLNCAWIQEAIEKTDAIYRKRPSDAVDTEGTLADIENRVILKVLKECNMNQSKAASRLGIGRSTMRRKMEAMNL